MIDYLEPLTEDNVDALLEQARRLSAALSGLGLGPGPAEEEPLLPGRGLEAGEGGPPSPAPSAAGLELGRSQPAAQPELGRECPAAGPELGWERPAAGQGESPRAADSLPETAEPQLSVPTAAPWREAGEGGDGRVGPSSLLEQLERLDRAAAPLLAADARTRRGEAGGSLSHGRLPALPGMGSPSGPGWPEGEPGQPGGWGGSPIPERNAPLPGGEIRWAERADRAFRRDSRRYDGGFYLY